MNILITGISGFVGSNFVNYLVNSDINIYGLDICTPKNNSILHTYSWDEIESNKFPPIDVIIHLAGKAHDTKNISLAEEYFKINTELTKKIFDYFLNSSTRKFIFFSSVKAAADFVPGDILTEDITPNPIGPYGESKIAAENYILQKFEKLNSEKTQKKIYILRPCMIHGPGNKGNLNLLYNIINKGIPWPLGAFDNKRSFTSIDNLSYIIEALINMDISSGVYNVADDEALSTNELITLMYEAMGKKTKIWYLPEKLIKIFARLGDVIKLPLNSDRLNKLTENYIVSNAKIKSAINLKSMPFRAKVGFTKTIKSFIEDDLI